MALLLVAGAGGALALQVGLAAPAAIAVFETWGVEAIQRYNHDLAWRAAHHVSQRWDITLDVPETMIGTMATVTLPASLGRTREDAARLSQQILRGARVLVCGSVAMGRAVAAELDAILVPHGLSVAVLKSEGRYVEDVF